MELQRKGTTGFDDGLCVFLQLFIFALISAAMAEG